jgi:acetylornithine deacetylase
VNPYAGAPPTGSEGPGQEHIRPRLEALGGKTHLFEPPPDTYQRMGVLGPRGRSWQGRPNLVTTFDLGPGPRLVINSHMDTVGVAGMRIAPFEPRIADGLLYGRGSSDDKGGIAMGLTAIAAALSVADQLGGTIIHQSVVDEECSGSGAGTLACCLAGHTGDEAIVVDGSAMALMRGCQGVLTVDLRLTGRGGHAARGGVNAIEKGVYLAHQALLPFIQRRRAAGYQVNLGVFQGGVHPAVVPGSALLSLNLVYGHAEAVAAEAAGRGWSGVPLREAFAAAIRQAEAGDDWLRDHPAEIDWVKDLIPYQIPAETPVVQRLADAAAAIHGQRLEPAVMDAWADAANLVRFGATPAVLFGCGSEGKAHSEDEFIRLADLVASTRTLALYLVRRLRRG